MRKGQTKGEKGLTVRVSTRLSTAQYEQLEALRKQTKGESFSGLLRKIIAKRPIKVYTRDESLDLLMEELAANRAEIRRIGININQLAKLFNSYPELKSKILFAKNGYQRYLAIEKNIEKILAITQELAKQWLSG